MFLRKGYKLWRVIILYVIFTQEPNCPPLYTLLDFDWSLTNSFLKRVTDFEESSFYMSSSHRSLTVPLCIQLLDFDWSLTNSFLKRVTDFAEWEFYMSSSHRSQPNQKMPRPCRVRSQPNQKMPRPCRVRSTDEKQPSKPRWRPRNPRCLPRSTRGFSENIGKRWKRWLGDWMWPRRGRGDTWRIN